MFQTFDCDAIMKTPNESTIEVPGEAKDGQMDDTVELFSSIDSTIEGTEDEQADDTIKSFAPALMSTPSCVTAGSGSLVSSVCSSFVYLIIYIR